MGWRSNRTPTLKFMIDECRHSPLLARLPATLESGGLCQLAKIMSFSPSFLRRQESIPRVAGWFQSIGQKFRQLL
jgi:hypothetical protein